MSALEDLERGGAPPRHRREPRRLLPRAPRGARGCCGGRAPAATSSSTRRRTCSRPGADFGAYSASKAGGAPARRRWRRSSWPCGVRVNMINADAVFGDARGRRGCGRRSGRRARGRAVSTRGAPGLLPPAQPAPRAGHARARRQRGRVLRLEPTPTTGATLPGRRRRRRGVPALAGGGRSALLSGLSPVKARPWPWVRVRR